MKNIYGKKVGYKLDWLTIALRFRNSEEKSKFGHFDLEKELIKRGYPVRDPKKDDDLSSFRGYNMDLSKIVKIGEHDFTLHRRQEFDEVMDENMEMTYVPTYISGLIVLGGKALSKIGYEATIKLLKDLEDISYLTRADVASDLVYRKEEDTEKALSSFAEVVGFTPNYKGMMYQNPDNRIGSGLKNSKSPMKRAEVIASNGATVYIGGKESKFKITAYNKRSEVLAKTNNTKDPGPLMRVELEVKEELAEASRKMILSSKADSEETLKRLWHNLANDRITIKKEVGSEETERLGEFMGIGSATKVTLDYTKIEGDEMEYEEWVKQMVSPKFNKLNKGETPKKTAENWLKLAMVKEMSGEDRAYFEEVIKNLPDN